MRRTRLAPVLNGIVDVQVDGSGDLVRDHGEVLLFAVDLDDVHLLEDPMLSVFGVGVENASSRRGKCKIGKLVKTLFSKLGNWDRHSFVFISRKPCLQICPVWFDSFNLQSVIFSKSGNWARHIFVFVWGKPCLQNCHV